MIEAKIMEDTEGQIQSTLERAIIVDYGQMSFQIRDILGRAVRGSPVEWSKYGQVSEAARVFLESSGARIPTAEISVVISHLLVAPSPRRQTEILKAIDFLVTPDQETIDGERRSLIKTMVLEEGMAGVKREGSIEWVLPFFQNPENQKGREDLLAEALDHVKPDQRWWSTRPVLDFLQNPSNQQGRESLVEASLVKAKQDRKWEGILVFLSNPENQAGREELLSEALKEGKTREILQFFKNPQNLIGREAEFKEAWDNAIKYSPRDLLVFFQNPANKVGNEDLVEQALRDARKGKHPSYYLLLEYYSNPENRDGDEEYVEELLQDVIWKSREDGYWSEIPDFFRYPENVPKSQVSQELSRKICSAINQISDENLRAKFFVIFEDYLEDDDNPLSLLALESSEDLPLLVAGYTLGIDPLVLKSWQLTEREKETLLPVFSRLSENWRLMFENIQLPFKPRPAVKQIHDFNQRLTDWFSTLDLLGNLPYNLAGHELIKSHLEKLSEIQARHGINSTSLDFSFGFLREVVEEVSKMQNEALQKFIKVFGLEEKDITYEQFIKFVVSWNREIQSLTALSVHYQDEHEDGSLLLGKIAESIIRGNYYQSRYDLFDPLTREQLGPILDHIDEKEQPAALHIWRSLNPRFTIATETKVAKGEIRLSDIREELQKRLTSEGHFHASQLFNLEGLSTLPQDKRDYVLDTLLKYLNGSKEAINFGQFSSELRPYLSSERISSLISLTQFLKDLFSGTKPSSEMSSSLGRVLRNIKQKWPELYNLEMVSLDLGNYLESKLDEATQQPVQQETSRKIYLSFVSDHPKTLLEIGKYPDSSSCQNYESTGEYNKALLGYVFDSHIKAACVVEVDLGLEFDEEQLNKSQMELDEGKRKIVITLPSGKKIETSFSRPLGRKMVMLGSRDGQPHLVVEPLYYSGIGESTANQLIDDDLKALETRFSQIGLNLKIASENTEGIQIAGSHNPAGHYNDIASSAMGEEGEPYEI